MDGSTPGLPTAHHLHLQYAWGVDSSVGKESTCHAGDPRVDSWVRKIWWRRDRLPTPVFLGFPCGSAGKESACNVGDLGLIPGLGRSPGEGKGYPYPEFWPGEFHGLCKSMGLQGVGHDWATFTFSWGVVIGRIQVGRNRYPPHDIYTLILSPPFIVSHLKAHLLINIIQQKLSWWFTG